MFVASPLEITNTMHSNCEYFYKNACFKSDPKTITWLVFVQPKLSSFNKEKFDKGKEKEDNGRVTEEAGGS